MLRSFLPSVVRFSEADGAVVYVADNGSTDASVAMLRREFPSVHLILLEENHGFADGYNLALKQVEAEYVVLLNSDVEVTEHWLVPLAEYMDAYPETAACQPKIRSWRNKGQFEYAGAAGGFIDRYGYPFAKHIKKKWAMDLIYYLMKPLEWLFLLVLYLVDRKPENRIAMQYIKPIPEDFDPRKLPKSPIST